MHAQRVKDLVRQGESFELEFKRATKGSLHDTDIVHAAMCLANGRGGTLILGVEDDGTFTGVSPRHGANTDPARIQALIVNKTQPPLAASVELVTVDSVDVIVIQVPTSEMPVGTTEGVFKRRALRFDGKPECVAYAPHEIISSAYSAVGRDFARVVAPQATWDDLSDLEFERFRTLVHQRGGDRSLEGLSNRDVARALGALDPGHGSEAITLGGLLLFGKESAVGRYVPGHEVAFQEELPGRSTNDVARLPLLKAMEFLTDRLDARHVEEEVMWGMLRIPIERIPRAAAREAIANALVHRDYAELGLTRVSLTPEVFSVVSPGGFPRGVTQGNLMSVTQPRSPMLADAFKRAGLVERTGRGVGRIYDALLRTGRAEPDYSFSTSHSVALRLATGAADLDFARFIIAAEAERGSPLTLAGIRILHALRADGPASTPELAADLFMTRDETRDMVNALIGDGYVVARGTGRGRRLHLSPAFRRMSTSKSAEIRARDPEPLQQQDMVLTFVTEYGSITRKEAAELCKLSDDAASRLLRGMTKKGLLSMQGARRTARYVAPGAPR